MKTLFIGLEKDKDGNPLLPATVSRIVIEIKTQAARIFGGYSASVVSGGWLNESGKLIEEAALRLELDSRDDDQITVFTAWVAAQLNQSCVLLSSTESTQDYIKAAILPACSLLKFAS